MLSYETDCTFCVEASAQMYDWLCQSLHYYHVSNEDVADN